MSIVCFHLHLIRMEQTKWGKIMYCLAGFELWPIYCEIGLIQFCWGNFKSYFERITRWAHGMFWDRWKDEDSDGQTKSCMSLLMSRWCAAYCCLPIAGICAYIALAFMAFVCCALPAPFVMVYLVCAGEFIYLMKLCTLKNIWITREDLESNFN